MNAKGTRYVHVTVFTAFMSALLAGMALVTAIGMKESGAADVYMEATRPDFQRIPIGILGFKDTAVPASVTDRPGNRLADVLKADLRRSLVFTVADIGALGIKLDGLNGSETETSKALLRQVTEQGISVLVWGTMTPNGSDFLLKGQVYDGNSDAIVDEKEYVGSRQVLRLMAHRLADQLVFKYTGEQGIARTKIAFVSEQDGGRELYIMDYDGYAPRQVTADGFLNLMPRWSPDRRYLVFTAFRSRGKQDIHLVELATGKRWTLVSQPGLNITPAVSPDGNFLAYASSQEGTVELYKMDTRTKAVQRLTFHAAGDLSPSWSPTGQEIAFTSDRGGGPQIYLMSADGSNIRRLTYDGDYNAAPAWSPRANWIAYVCRTVERQYKLCMISPDGEKRQQITTGPGVDDSPSWSPDGRHLAFSSNRDGKSHIYMINSDGTELERLTSGGAHHSSPTWSPF
jgi:TolB protein